MAEQAGITLTREDLANIIGVAVTAAVQEVNKPKPLTRQEVAEIEQAQQHRAEVAGNYRAQKANERAFQEQICSHEHTKQAGGGTHCVFVRDNDHPGDAGYILCQNCQGRIRPDSEKWRKLDPNAIFDTNKFNKLFQDCAQGSGEIIG
jgi:hypothetical protein